MLQMPKTIEFRYSTGTLTYRTSFSEACKVLGSGHLNQPQGIAINSEGNIYVADMMNHAVQAFTPDGKFILKFGKYGPATTPGAICSPMAITTDGEDNVYVGSATGTISIFDKEGNFLRQFGSHGSELGQFNQIKGMHIDREGHLYVCEWTSNRIQIFQGSPSMEESKEERNSVSEELSTNTPDLSKPAYLIGPSSSLPLKVLSGIEQSSGIAVAKNGEVIVASWSKHKVFIYSSKENNYHLIAEVGGEGSLDGKFFYPSGVAVTRENHILVTSHNKLQWFTMEGNLVHAVGGLGRDKMEFDSPTDVAVGNGGRIYVLDSKNKRVQILNGDGSYCGCFGFPHLTQKKDDAPTALAINSEGNLYFVDSRNDCVHVFSSSGELLFKFGKSGSWIERGTLNHPTAIAIDAEDDVFVGDNFQISIFDKSGSFIRAFGERGNQPGQFDRIKGMHLGKSGYLYISECSNNRVQILEVDQSSKEHEVPDKCTTILSRRPVYTIGPTSDMPVKILSNIMEPWGITTAPNNDVFVVSKRGKKVLVYNGHDYEFKEEIDKIFWEFSRDNEIVDPAGIAICEDGCLLINLKSSW